MFERFGPRARFRCWGLEFVLSCLGLGCEGTGFKFGGFRFAPGMWFGLLSAAVSEGLGAY